MKEIVAAVAALIIGTAIPGTLRAQPGSTALPELSFTVSPRGNGMGGISATIPMPDASATIGNPGQLGYSSIDNLFTASVYSPETRLLPVLTTDLFGSETMTVSAINAGVNLNDIVSLPFSAGIGFGYSRTHMDFGSFIVTNSYSPVPIAVLSLNDTYTDVSVGLGIEYIARIGIGINFKSITSSFPSIGLTANPVEATATPKATDFGVLLNVPLVAVVNEASGSQLEISKGIAPFLDVSAGYVRSNVGDGVVYTDAAQSDPLPRTAVLGLGLGAGFSARVENANWKIAAFEVVHQAEDVLVNRYSDGTFDYKGGIGDLSIGDNVISGKVTGNVLVRKGWEIGAGEFLYIRGGSITSNTLDQKTSGYSICLGGLVRLLDFVSPALAETPWIAFVGKHIDVQYHSATYASTDLWDGTTFKEFGLVIHGLPW